MGCLPTSGSGTALRGGLSLFPNTPSWVLWRPRRHWHQLDGEGTASDEKVRVMTLGGARAGGLEAKALPAAGEEAGGPGLVQTPL